MNYADTVNPTIPQVYVAKGQTIEFLALGGSEISSIYSSYGNMVEGKVDYCEIYDAPTAQAGLSVGESLSIYGQTNGVPAEATEFGVYLNGEKQILTTEANKFSVKVNAKDANANQTIKPYYVMDGSKVVMGEAYTVTVNSMLNDYAESDDEAIAKAAIATLTYTAAAEAYFDDTAAAPAIVAPANKDAYVAKKNTVGFEAYNGEGKVEFRGISLLLNDLINIKIVINGTLPAGATLQVAADATFTAPETVRGEATEDGTGTKFIMEGISAKNWNTDYYIRVVDENGSAISDTLCYSVAAYYGRMIENEAATDKLKAVISSLMSLYEAVSEN